MFIFFNVSISGRLEDDEREVAEEATSNPGLSRR